MKDSYDAPMAGRATIFEDISSVTIKIPAHKRILISLFIAVWLCGWVYGLFMALSMLVSSGGGFVLGFMLVWLTGWTLGGLAALFSLVWMLVGFERVTIDPDGIKIERIIGPLRREKNCAMEHVRDLRVFEGGSVSKFQQAGMDWLAGYGQGSIRFDYGRGTRGFGLELEAGEAKEIVVLIRKRFPQLAQ